MRQGTAGEGRKTRGLTPNNMTLWGAALISLERHGPRMGGGGRGGREEQQVPKNQSEQRSLSEDQENARVLLAGTETRVSLCDWPHPSICIARGPAIKLLEREKWEFLHLLYERLESAVKTEPVQTNSAKQSDWAGFRAFFFFLRRLTYD